MEIYLCDINKELVDCWLKYVKSHEWTSIHINVYHGSIFDIDSLISIVTPGNSFGIMNGGLDSEILKIYGDDIQNMVRRNIAIRFQGELVVGGCVTITSREPLRLITYAPTMRVPMKLPKDSVNPYIATRAALFELRRTGFGSSHVAAIPGMGSGIGCVPEDICARQMFEALKVFDAVMDNNDVGKHPAESNGYCWEFMPESWTQACMEHQRLWTDEPWELDIRREDSVPLQNM